MNSVPEGAAVITVMPGWAIITMQGEVLSIELPLLTDDAIGDLQLSWDGSYRLLASPKGQGAPRFTQWTVLAYLWLAVSKPLAEVIRQRPSLQRLWWVPVGGLSDLPLSAADGASYTTWQNHARDPEDPSGADSSLRQLGRQARVSWAPLELSLDRLATALTRNAPESASNAGNQDLSELTHSWLPTLHHLTRSGASPSRRPASTGRLVVAVDVHGDDALLPNAPREAEIVAETWGGAEVLCGRDATLTTVSSALPDAVMVHFACHGVTYAERPGGYYLALAGDDVLTVAEIASLRSEKFGLAVLSACNTALTKGHSERVSLATAFIAAGFAEVVASIAPVADQHAVRFSELFHHHIQQANAEPGNGRRADQALAKALMTLRDEYPEEPYAWAIWVHTGATV